MKKNQTKQEPYDLIIVGGGIMGLLSAYAASAYTSNIALLEKRTIGNKEASSFSFTRSMRTDYLDPYYARLANEARLLWKDLEKHAEAPLLVEAGCLNLVSKAITPDINNTYGERSYQVLRDLNFAPEKLSQAQLQDRYPQFTADQAYIDQRGGYFDLPAITQTLLDILAERGIKIIEEVAVTAIEETDANVIVTTDNGGLSAGKLIVTAGLWVNDVLALVKDNQLSLPITLDKPKECRYFYPDNLEAFRPQNFPVFAYLDVGIYGHPIFDAQKGAVKVSYYNPPDLAVDQTKITCIDDFIRQCLPALQAVRSEPVTDADQCSYDLVADDNFIVGPLPGYQNIIIGAGWRGTGYKFAPLMGKILSQLALQGGTVYDIQTFNLGRFTT